MKKNSSRVILLIVIFLAIIVIGIIGLSFAAFSSSEDNKNYNTIATGNISMTYTEAVNGISITNAFPISDEVGKILGGDNQYFDFTVTSDIDGEATIDYEIAAIKQNSSSIDNSDVKLYLEQQKSGTYTQLFEPTVFKGIGNDSEIGSPKGSMVLASVTKNQSAVDNYRLRMWLAENADLQDSELTFEIKVNVYAKSR